MYLVKGRYVKRPSDVHQLNFHSVLRQILGFGFGLTLQLQKQSHRNKVTLTNS